MNLMNIVLMMGHAPGQQSGDSMLSTIMMFIILGIPLFWIIPSSIKASKRNKIRQKFQKEILENNSNNSIKNDQINKIERLAKLKEQGFLSEDEFNAEKRKILNNLL